MEHEDLKPSRTADQNRSAKRAVRTSVRDSYSHCQADSPQWAHKSGKCEASMTQTDFAHRIDVAQSFLSALAARV